MERGRIQSIVSENWGHGVVYTYDSDLIKSIQAVNENGFEKEHAIRQNEMHSRISDAFENVADKIVMVPEPDVPMEGLSFMMSSLFASLLEDIMAQLWCLTQCNNELKIIKTVYDLDHLRAIKFQVASSASETADELTGIDPRNLECDIYKIKKLDADRHFITNVIIQTYVDLVEHFTFHPIKSVIAEIDERDKHRVEVEEEEGRNRILRRELSRQVRQQRNHIKSALYDTDVTIDRLRVHVEDFVLYTEIRGRYVNNWQSARMEQHTLTLSNIENVPGSNITMLKQKTEHEQRVHTEIDLVCTIAINEILANIEEWMEKYETDMEKIDLDIQIKKNEYQNMRDKRIELEHTLKLHDQQMKAWIQFKEEREKARQYYELMMKSAIIVQAWWRGLIVRLQLGPFRPKKPKRGGKKK